MGIFINGKNFVSFWNEWGGKYIDWDNSKALSEQNGDIEIDGNNSWNLENKNGNVKVNWSNDWDIENKNGNIKVKKKNTWSITNKNGNIAIGWENTWEIENKNGNISIDSDNTNKISNQNGTVDIDGSNTSTIVSGNGTVKVKATNSWKIQIESWNLQVWSNKWSLESQWGIIVIKDIGLKLERQGWNGANIIIWWTSNSIFGNISGGNIVISWSSSSKIIVNWVDVSKQVNSEKWWAINKLVFESPDGSLVIDFTKNEITTWWQSIWSQKSINGYTIIDSSKWVYTLSYKDQKIKATENQVNVDHI